MLVSDDRPDVAVPQGATKRGPIMRGELRSESAVFPGMLVQFSKINPRSRKGKIYLYPTAEQARRLFGVMSPFEFEGSLSPRDGVEERWTASGIWLKSGSEIGHREMRCLTFCSGRIENLQITVNSQEKIFAKTGPFAWFTTNRCFLLQVLANAEEKEIADGVKYGFQNEPFSFSISDGASAEIRRYVKSLSVGVAKDSKKMGYSIHVRGFKDVQRVKQDIEGLLIITSLASRERSMFWHWSTEETSTVQRRHWRFGITKFPRRGNHTDPLFPRNRANCSSLLTEALRNYLTAKNTELLDSAIDALTSPDLPLEVQIVRLFSGIQSALLFSLQEPMKAKRPLVRSLYAKFIKKFTPNFGDLWPLLTAPSGASLYQIRNAAVHGEVFSEKDLLALSYAAENIRWLLERIILISLGCDVTSSAVSPRRLRNYYAYRWQHEQQRLVL